jgi:peptidoglycan/xylan/chitin deacetylase (PgdA/CDA1 family)
MYIRWSHAHLDTLTGDQIISEITQLENALVNIIGVFPYYFRCPYFECNSTTLLYLYAYQYHVIQCDFDTLDWMYNTADTISTAEYNFASNFSNGGTLELSHDVQPYTASELVDYMISTITAKGLTSVTVGECMGDPQSNW